MRMGLDPVSNWFDSEVKTLLAVKVDEVIEDARRRRDQASESEAVGLFVYAFGGLEMHFASLQRVLQMVVDELDARSKDLHAMNLAAEDVLNVDADAVDAPAGFAKVYEVLYAAQEAYLRRMSQEEGVGRQKLSDDELEPLG